ncbi:MAG TPA: hypothetical protein VFU62_03840 [Hanamia sp.]|nr:hypothetical protein [Hanamia sp.]
MTPTHETDLPTSKGGIIPSSNSFGERKNCPSVIEIRLVSIQAEISCSSVSMTGSAVRVFQTEVIPAKN